MGKSKLLRKFFSKFVLSSVIFAGGTLCAQVISTNATEVRFNYDATFVADPNGADEINQAYQHHIFLFGVMHSPELTERMGIDADVIGGIGSPRSDVSLKIVKRVENETGSLITYRARGKMLLHNRVARRALQRGSLEFPMPLEPSEIYDRNCTDEHYSSIGDYWYFWNPFRLGCEHLQSEPYSQMVSVHFRPADQRKLDPSPRLDLLRGANGNGELFSIYIVHGFAESDTDPTDEARVNFEKLSNDLRKHGFSEDVRYSGMRRPLRVYTKELTLKSGRKINVEVKSLLVETGIEARGLTFARFFREAVESADVIFYAGHSGLGGNLDIPALEKKAGAFTFPKNKRQIFFFDSCSSYSYYLVPFSAEKTRARIDVVTNALSSYFHTGGLVLSAFLEVLLNEQVNDMPWIEILKKIERELDGESYLMNVGGV